MSLDWGVKVSKPGVSVTTATDDQLYYSSKFDSLKASSVSSTTINFLKTSTVQTLDVNHGLGYTPSYFFGVFLDSGAVVPLPYLNLFSEISTRIANIGVFADTTKVRVTVTGFVGASDVTIGFQWYIFYNRLD